MEQPIDCNFQDVGPYKLCTNVYCAKHTRTLLEQEKEQLLTLMLGAFIHERMICAANLIDEINAGTHKARAYGMEVRALLRQARQARAWQKERGALQMDRVRMDRLRKWWDKDFSVPQVCKELRQLSDEDAAATWALIRDEWGPNSPRTVRLIGELMGWLTTKAINTEGEWTERTERG